ncbi:MAG: AAA family ATPase, partial [Clostridia bacterium]|nr:AAA family ATPase [Clostridia bacterium]
MKRLISDRLLQWKDKKNRKPLILWGARQTGKTWALQEFGRTQFQNCLYISFYNNKKMAQIF